MAAGVAALGLFHRAWLEACRRSEAIAERNLLRRSVRRIRRLHDKPREGILRNFRVLAATGATTPEWWRARDSSRRRYSVSAGSSCNSLERFPAQQPSPALRL